MCWSSALVWMSVSIFKVASRERIGPRAAIQPVRRAPPTGVGGAAAPVDARRRRGRGPRGGYPADPQAAADGLRERVDVDHVRWGLGAQAPRPRALVAQRRVHALLQHEERP